MRLKFEGWYAEELSRMASEHNTTPTQILKQYISQQAHGAKEACDDTIRTLKPYPTERKQSETTS